MSKASSALATEQPVENKITAWIDKQAESPYPMWALSAATLATLPLSVKKAPGIPGLFQTMAFAGDAENGSGIATAWCLSWSFLNAKSALKSMRPVPIALLGAVALNTVIYGKKTLQVNGYI
ncbi:hypothetical protein MUCCIDRAFT_106511 [Mucor lusitanicus CBS 277.49]|uniref:Uncharacterized protein n=1 Tax=Mucor lusitanicus CBS 277.49 TaxID=747725 RepID=A0A162TP33_MUCCL|nr:hypothetical protein MUCCIDRAFT_106511 [Mucor lusitanicus CBS 277.49]